MKKVHSFLTTKILLFSLLCRSLGAESVPSEAEQEETRPFNPKIYLAPLLDILRGLGQSFFSVSQGSIILLELYTQESASDLRRIVAQRERGLGLDGEEQSILGFYETTVRFLQRYKGGLTRRRLEKIVGENLLIDFA